MKTSIIMVCYDQLQSARHTSMAAVSNILRYTDPNDYELIIVDCVPKYGFRDDYKNLKIDKMITLTEDPGYYAAMNIGAKEATGDYLCFIENDVFVYKNWLNELKWYLDNDKLDAVLPHQIPNTYAKTLEFESLGWEEAIGKGASEQGLILIKKDSFEKIGGWDPQLKEGYGWKNFYMQMGKENLRYNNTAKCMITHITGMSYYNTMETDRPKFDRISKLENEYINGQT